MRRFVLLRMHNKIAYRITIFEYIFVSIISSGSVQKYCPYLMVRCFVFTLALFIHKQFLIYFQNAFANQKNTLHVRITQKYIKFEEKMKYRNFALKIIKNNIGIIHKSKL